MSQEQVEKYIELQEKLQDVSNRKIRIEEQYKAKKQALKELITDIKKEGHEPNELKKVISDMEKEFDSELSKFEGDLNNISNKLSKIEG
jgi:uncharacterized tellurite resistance protein B-like protein